MYTEEDRLAQASKVYGFTLDDTYNADRLRALLL
jgi:hypothetical protein